MGCIPYVLTTTQSLDRALTPPDKKIEVFFEARAQSPLKLVWRNLWRGLVMRCIGRKWALRAQVFAQVENAAPAVGEGGEAPVAAAP